MNLCLLFIFEMIALILMISFELENGEWEKLLFYFSETNS